ncbi:MAG: CCA tRNA nucleotidyltransferase [Rickettsiales bacterium]|nr:CCA tRNA nucleotidyltransferase [Rickettsiales bacterium]
MLKNLFNSESVQKIFDILKSVGSESRFIGGCVRDAVLGINISDIDIATTCLPQEIESVLNKYGIKTFTVGKDFGTIVAVTEQGSYEITTLRKDVEFYNGRHAVVEYSQDWQEDAARRDFTFNAMSYCPYQDKLFDYFSGQEDLAKGFVRFIGKANDRVSEDYLRILRFFRFYTYYGKSFDVESFNACVKNAKNLSKISAERRWQELAKILSNKNYIDTLDLMIQNNVIQHVLSVDVPCAIIDDLKLVNSFLIEKKHDISYMFVLFSLSYLAKIKIKDLKKVLRLSNKEEKYLSTILECVNAVRSGNITPSLYWYIYKWHNLLLDGLIFVMAIDKSSAWVSLYDEVKNVLTKSLVMFPLTGHDIIEHFDVDVNDQRIGGLLDSGKKFWCKEKFKPTKEQIIQYIKVHEK